ncbi:MAG: sugar ABC transporter permease [Clostridia bacterium]|nr:sugar ABC transporter permease [Clostridia bacterium]
MRTQARRSYLSHYAMMSPFLLAFLTFTILPILAAILLSFTDFNMLQLPSFVGMDNYIRLLFEDDVYMIALKNTLILALVTGPIGYILSFVIAWLINELGYRLRVLFTFFMYTPALCGGAVTIWAYIFSSDSQGFLNDILLKLGIISDPISWLTNPQYNLVIVMIITIWGSFGTGFLSFVSGLQSLDRTYFEAAAIDGLRNRWQELYYVTFPQMKEFLLFGAVQSVSSAFSIAPTITGNPSTNYSTHTLVLHISDHAQIRYEMGYASAAAVVLFILMMAAWIGTKKLLSKVSA